MVGDLDAAQAQFAPHGSIQQDHPVGKVQFRHRLFSTQILYSHRRSRYRTPLDLGSAFHWQHNTQAQSINSQAALLSDKIPVIAPLRERISAPISSRHSLREITRCFCY
jgi:hypothetical protein